jgi:hypothetical protein
MNGSCETDIVRATERMLDDDETLRTIRLVGLRTTMYTHILPFIDALEQTCAPIEEMSLEQCYFWRYERIISALWALPTLRVLRLCNLIVISYTERCGYDEHELDERELAAFLENIPATLELLVVSGAHLSDANLRQIRAHFCPPEHDAILQKIGEHASRVLRPLLGTRIWCARGTACVCGL